MPSSVPSHLSSTQHLREVVASLLAQTTRLTQSQVQSALWSVELWENGEKFLAQFTGNHNSLTGQLVNLRRALNGDFDDVKASSAPEEISPSTVHNPFPEATEIDKLPQHVQNSWSHVQKLSPEQQSKISYYEKNGEWFINLNGTKISLQNETADNSPSKGINTAGNNTYFSQSAALSHAKTKWRSLPTNALWTQMADFLGWFKNLRDILQIPLTGWFLPDRGVQYVGDYADVWSADHGDCLYVVARGGNVGHTDYPANGRSVRLLDA